MSEKYKIQDQDKLHFVTFESPPWLGCCVSASGWRIRAKKN